MSTASPGIAFPAAPSERCPVTPCASRTFAWQVYVLLHGDNVLTDILVAIDAAVHVQGLQAAKVRESVFKLSSCLQSTLKFSSPAARYRCTISSPAAGLGRAILSRPFFGARAALSVGRSRLALVAGSWSSSPPRTRRRLVGVSLAASPPLAAATARTAATVATSMASLPPLLLRLRTSARCRHRRASAIVQWASLSFCITCAPWPCVSVNVSLCAQPVVDWWFNRPRHMGAKTKGFRVLSL